jgi:LCP family protein required for cell wall assembly
MIVVGLVFGIKLAGNWQKPLNESLDLPTYTPSIAPPTATTAPTKPGEPTATPTLVPTATPVPQCGGPAVLTILAVGSDNRATGYLYGLSDVMRIVRVDFVNAKVTVVDLPRDIWVDIPDIADHYNIKKGKLNQAYFYGNPGMGYYEGPGEGPGLLARTIDQNFGVRVDNYIAVDMQTFVRFVNALGGIDVYLPEDVDGRPIDAKTEDMGYFYAGQQHLNGNAALRLARVRKKYNTFKRTSNQNIILCGIKEKALSPDVLPRIPQIIASFQDSMQTDLSPEQISQLACLAPKVGRSNLLLASMPEELFTGASQFDPTRNDNTFVLQADFDKVRELLAQFQAGTWPTPSPDNGEACPTPPPTRTPKPK